MNSKRKSALILAVICAILFTIIFALPSHSLSAGGSTNETKITLSSLIATLGGTYNSGYGTTYNTFWVPWLLLVTVILGTALILSKKTSMIGFGLILGSQGVAFASMINLYVMYSQNTSYKVSVRFCGVLEYIIVILTIIAAALYYAANVEEARTLSYRSSYSSANTTTQPQNTPQSSYRPTGKALTQDDQEKLSFWKGLLDQDLITPEDYEKKKKEILGL